MPPLRSCRRTARLLVVLCLLARCRATDQGAPSADPTIDPNAALAQSYADPSAAPDQPSDSSSVTTSAALDQPPALSPTVEPDAALDQLLRMLRVIRTRVVKSATEPIVARQNSQQSQLDSISSQLSSQQAELTDVTGKLSSQESRVDSVNHRLDSLNSRLDYWLESLGTRLDSLDSKLESMDSRLDSMSTQLDSVDSRLNSTDSRLDELSTRVDRDLAAASSPPRDCSDLEAGAQSGVHLVYPGLGVTAAAAAAAYCDMDTDGGNWTVFQRRADVLPRQDFYLDWTAYKEGFGELDAEFWWGLERLWLVTALPDRTYELRVDLEDFDGGRRHAVYQGFQVTSERSGYRLVGGTYTGDAGDSLSQHFGHRFSTKDRDQDTGKTHCAQTREGGWWYHACHDANLNGKYLAGKTAKGVYGVNWPTWRGWLYSLKTVEMKLRPTNKAG